jgi:PKD repeat protein
VWSFGDGATATATAPTVEHTYASPGTYTVQLTVTDGYGTSSSVSQQLIVHALPTAAFTSSPSHPLEHSPVGFSAAGSSDSEPGVPITSYSWRFGDGSSATGLSPTHTYPSPGTYTVALVVTNSLGLSAGSTQLVTVLAPPLVGFTVKTQHPVTGQPVRFASSSSTAGGAITSYRWSFGDGTPAATGSSPTQLYAKPGSYMVTLTVLDSFGHSATAVTRVTVALAGRITKVSIARKATGTVLVVSVNEAGRLSIGGNAITVRKAGSARFLVRLSTSEEHTLNSDRRLTLHVLVHFAPHAGPRQTRTVALTLRPGHAASARLADVRA